jgi:hypothetical protein
VVGVSCECAAAIVDRVLIISPSFASKDYEVAGVGRFGHLSDTDPTLFISQLPATKRPSIIDLDHGPTKKMTQHHYHFLSYVIRVV